MSAPKVVPFPNKLSPEWRGPKGRPGAVVIAPGRRAGEWQAWAEIPGGDTLLATGTDKAVIYGHGRDLAREHNVSLRLNESFTPRTKFGEIRRSANFQDFGDPIGVYQNGGAA